MEDMFKRLRDQREAWAKQATTGERFSVPREKGDVDVLIYRPENPADGKLPVLFNMHGGAWVGGDAVLMESFCQLLANEIPCVVVNVNYKKADIHPYPYPVVEVADAVEYFIAHADEYDIDVNRIAVGGHSAGGNIAAGAALMLKERGVTLACQMLVYPCTDLYRQGELSDILKIYLPGGATTERFASPLFASDAALENVCPAIFIECGLDTLRAQGIAYAKRLINVGVPVKVKEYKKALHGFLEVCRSDYDQSDPRITPEQTKYCRDCEQYLIRELRAYFEEA